jgi:hypothetical protein
MPSIRRNVCARRSRPARAAGFLVSGSRLDAAALILEVGILALVRAAGDKLRRRCISWRLLPRMRPEKPATRETG